MRRKTNYIDNLIAKRHYVAPEVLVERIEESDMVAGTVKTDGQTTGDGETIGNGSASAKAGRFDPFFDDDNDFEE